MSTFTPMSRFPLKGAGTGAAMLLSLWGLMAPSLALAAPNREAKMYVITTWTNTCTGGTRDYWDNMVDEWYDEMDEHGYYYKDGSWTNGSQSPKHFCDPDITSGCADDNHVDDADAAMIGLHGADSSNHWRGSMRAPDSNGDCRLDAAEGAGSDELFVGDQDLEYLHLSSCNSMDDDNLNFVWRSFQDVDSASNGNRLHQLNGFHGVMWIGYWYVEDYDDFAADAHDGSIQAAWLDNMYDGCWGDCDEQCPVSYSVGTSIADAEQRLLTERYTSSTFDPGAIKAWSYSFYEGCNPAGETAFNDPND